MRFVLLVTQAVAHLHHIQIVHMTGRVVFRKTFDVVQLLKHRSEVVENIPAGAPGIGHLCDPFTRKRPAAHIVYFVFSGLFLNFLYNISDHGVPGFLVQIEPSSAAPVHLDEIVAPVVKIAVEILLFMIQKAHIVIVHLMIGFPAAGGGTGIGVDTGLQPHLVQGVRQIFHSRREAVGMGVYIALGISSFLPAVVHIHIDVACIGKPQLHKLFCLRKNDLFVNIGSVGIPGSPTHNRGFSGFFLLGMARKRETRKETEYRQRQRKCQKNRKKSLHDSVPPFESGSS